ncbi:25S rRNA (cytosine-C(5))-methyltransferase NSUN5 [Juglans microcarpa x Juglans regia]|uniref:25S rRNA (cytosine-C(5))-methyltransferase NSUN5 n=1 Tax=Juglans microcarpa x Juglans regia TaxID=2249226 RepID=UPI001B7DD784|nr:25S rRNA (cytosine-C(5))-methyltransferase NSUN5 [Juglans microcarpa x Juglans regia]
MARAKKMKPVRATSTLGPADKLESKRLSNAERSAYFSRREAAKVLRSVLEGDARRRAVGSIKSLVFRPSVRNKKGTFALVCQTLKHLPIIKDVLEASSILKGKWKRQAELIYIITYDILFGQAVSLVGDAEKFLMQWKDDLQLALARLLVKENVKTVEDLVNLYQIPEVSKPRYVRVNTLKIDVDSALLELGRQNMVQKDDVVPDLLILPPATDLHNHPLVMNGSVFLQGKASSMVATALDPKPGWEVLDACSAPGNKTAHLAALMRGKGKIIACELNKERVKRLKETIKLSGASNIKVLNGDFLNINPKDPSVSTIRAILLDPSCSGSGTVSVRLDNLLPSYAAADVKDTERLNKLAAFQKKALAHALSFPAAERVVYSTCSIHQIENEDVIESVLPLAASYGFQLATPFPQWQRRGLPVFQGSQHLLRTDPAEDGEGFFIALFTKEDSINHFEKQAICNTSEALSRENCSDRLLNRKKRCVIPYVGTRLFQIWLHAKQDWPQKKQKHFQSK